MLLILYNLWCLLENNHQYIVFLQVQYFFCQISDLIFCFYNNAACNNSSRCTHKETVFFHGVYIVFFCFGRFKNIQCSSQISDIFFHKIRIISPADQFQVCDSRFLKAIKCTKPQPLAPGDSPYRLLPEFLWKVFPVPECHPGLMLFYHTLYSHSSVVRFLCM